MERYFKSVNNVTEVLREKQGSYIAAGKIKLTVSTRAKACWSLSTVLQQQDPARSRATRDHP